jgi:hypothetical protein
MTDNNTTKNTPAIGIRAWGTLPKQQSRQFDREDLPRLPFMKLNPGFNSVRIISGMGVFYQVRWKGPASKRSYGDKIRTSWPTYGDECPVKKFLGLEGRERYMVVAIDRADNELKLLDLSQLTAQSIEDILEAKNKKGKNLTPRDFDLSIKFDPKSKTATGYYSVVAEDTEPMSEADLKLIADIGGDEVIEKCLNRQLLCPKPEKVAQRLRDLGWDGKVVPREAKDSKGSKSQFEEPTADDYSFNRPEDSEEIEDDQSEAVNE